MARRLISLPEAAGTPEGCKVLGRGSTPMDAVLSIGPYGAEQAAAVEFSSSLPLFCAGAGAGEAISREGACCSFARGGATRAVTRKRETSEGALEMYITKRPCKNSASGNAPWARLQGSN